MDFIKEYKGLSIAGAIAVLLVLASINLFAVVVMISLVIFGLLLFLVMGAGQVPVDPKPRKFKQAPAPGSNDKQDSDPMKDASVLAMIIGAVGMMLLIL